jgi:hypothetical protein
MDLSNINEGFRINPSVQQGGTQTIQQSIYLTHLNPCGINLLIFEEIGATKITFFQLKVYLDNILKESTVMEKFMIVRETGTDYMYRPTFQTQLSYIYSVQEWGKEAYNFVPERTFEGYTWRLSVFNYNGVMVWDSLTPDLDSVIIKPDGTFDWTYVPLVLEFQSLPPVVVTVRNPFINDTSTAVQLYGISNNISFSNFLDRDTELGSSVVQSSFLVNQVALPESMMAIASLLTDPANTRVFGVTEYGFSARQDTKNTGLIGYHCVHLNDIKTIENNPILIETFFIRLSLEQNSLQS